MSGIFKKRFSLANFDSHFHGSFLQIVHVTTSRLRFGAPKAVGTLGTPKTSIARRYWLGLATSETQEKDTNVLDSWTHFQYVKRGDLLNGKCLLLGSSDMLWHPNETHKIMVAMQSAEFSILQSLSYTSRLNRHVKVNMCSEYLVGGWDRHRKKATQNGTKFPWFKVKKRVASNRLNDFHQPQSTRLPKTPRRGDADVTWT